MALHRDRQMARDFDGRLLADPLPVAATVTVLAVTVTVIAGIAG